MQSEQIKKGRELFNLAGRPTKKQLVLVYGEKGPKMTWAQRAAAGVPAEKFKEMLAAKAPQEEMNQTGENPVSPGPREPGSSKGRKVLARKDDAIKRRAYLESLDADAREFVDGYRRARAIDDEVTKIHRKFGSVVTEMRPRFLRIRAGFAHLRKNETVMGEPTGPAWAEKYLGVTYDWLCRCLNAAKAGRLLLADGTKVLEPSNTRRKRNNSKVTSPPKRESTVDTTDWSDDQYVTACVRFIESTLRPLESDPERFGRVAADIARQIVVDESAIIRNDMFAAERNAAIGASSDTDVPAPEGQGSSL